MLYNVNPIIVRTRTCYCPLFLIIAQLVVLLLHWIWIGLFIGRFHTVLAFYGIGKYRIIRSIVRCKIRNHCNSAVGVESHIKVTIR